MDTRRYIILGGGIAGMAAAEAIRERDADGRILMVSAEKELCFNRPMLIREFALDGSGADLFDRQQDWPEQHRIDVLRGTEAIRIDRAAKEVVLRAEDGTESREHYDRLIYALGASVTIPPIPGADGENVFTVRTREDMRRIRQAMRSARNAVVIGGGMLGLEDAWAMREQKLEVAIVEQRQRVAFGQIDQSAGNLMKKRIERMGVPVYVNAAVEEIGDGYVTFRQAAEQADPAAGPADLVDTAAGCSCGPCCCGQAAEAEERVTIPADMVILSTGVTPGSALGEAAGLEVVGEGERRWIAADETCRTGDPAIYAAGDAAAVNGRNDAIWDEAREMGRIAGANAAMDLAEAAVDPSGEAADDARPVYVPVTAEHVFNGFDTEVFTLADSSGAGTDGVYIRHADVEIFDYQRERYIRVSLQDGRIAGALLINASELAPELMEAYGRGADEEEARQIILRWKENHEVDFKPAEPFRKR